VRWAAAAAIACGLSAAGCATSLRGTRDLDLPPDRVMEEIRARIEHVSTISGEGVVTIEAPEESGSSSFSLDLRKPDSVRVGLSGPFGMRLGTLQFTRSRFVFYNAQENTAFTGSSDGSALHRMFNIRMGFDEVMRAFTGEFFDPASGAPDSFATDDGEYVLSYRRDGGRAEYRIDGDDFFVREFRMTDAQGRATLEANASEPEEDGGVVTPRLLRVVFPLERRSISVAYSDVGVNGEVSCAFTVPKSARVVER